MKVLHKLVANGWVPLRSMSCLLGYSHPTGIYARQRGKTPISTVKIGGQHRVYADEVLTTLNNVPEQDQYAANIILGVYRTLVNTSTTKE